MMDLFRFGMAYSEKSVNLSIILIFDELAKSRFQWSDSTLEGHALSWPGMPFIGGTKTDATERVPPEEGELTFCESVIIWNLEFVI